MAAYRDSFSETGWTRFLRALSASFHLGRFFRVEVRVFWITLLVMPLVLARTVEGLDFVHGAAWIASVTLWLYVTIWTHEMAHIAAGRRYGIHTPLITLSPLGGLAHLSEGAPSPAKEAVIAAAGPAVHLAWLALLVPLQLVLAEPTGDGLPYWLLFNLVGTFVTLNLWLMIFNLLPFFPMDGGRILRALMARRMHPNRASLVAARIGMGGAIAFMVLGVVLWITDGENLWGVILVCIGIANLGACRRETLLTMHRAGPYATSDPRAPWQDDPEAWKAGAASGGAGDEEPRSGFRERRRAKREARRREQAAQAERSLAADVDRVLARVSEVGMDGLSAAERKILDRAAKRGRAD